MSVRNLDKIFKPQRIAVVGASDERPKVGWTVLRNLIGAGFGGVVYPINARREAVQGIQAHPHVSALPKPVDLAIICTPAPTVPGLIRECGEAGILGIVILSAGFARRAPRGKRWKSNFGRNGRVSTACGLSGRIVWGSSLRMCG